MTAPVPSLPQAVAKVQIVGWVKGEVKVTTTKTGKKVANFNVYAGKQHGNFRIVAWEEEAERVEKQAVNGAHVLVEGPIANRSYDDKGTTKWITEVTVRHFELFSAPDAPSF